MAAPPTHATRQPTNPVPLSLPHKPLLQAAMKHPYSRYGYVAVVLTGLLGWFIATEEKKHAREHEQSGGSSGIGSGDASGGK